jgi:hypothetical protein
MNVKVSIAVVLLGLAACGEEPQPKPEEPVGDGIPVIDLPMGLVKGPLTVQGIITLPADTRPGVYTVFEFDQPTSGPIPDITVLVGPDTTDAKKMRFVLKGLKDGEYKFKFFVDQNNNRGMDSGDYEGWYAGTVDNPLLSYEVATVLKLEGRDHEGIDFGIGRKP